MAYKGDDFYCDMALSGKADIKIVEQTDTILAFHHTKPFWPIHIIVIPKAHVPSLIDLGGHDPSILMDIMNMVQKIAADVTKQYGAAGVLTNLGEYQDSKHLHFHINFGKPLREDTRV